MSVKEIWRKNIDRISKTGYDKYTEWHDMSNTLQKYLEGVLFTWLVQEQLRLRHMPARE